MVNSKAFSCEIEPNVGLILVKPMAKTFTMCKVPDKFIEK
jgi:hypothetical protein